MAKSKKRIVVDTGNTASGRMVVLIDSNLDEFLAKRRLRTKFLKYASRAWHSSVISMKSITSAFVWGNTDEGHEYWLNVNNDYVSFLIKNK